MIRYIFDTISLFIVWNAEYHVVVDCIGLVCKSRIIFSIETIESRISIAVGGGGAG